MAPEPADPDEGLTPFERTRQALHRAINRICDAWPHALDDANARGYGTGHTYDAPSTGATLIVDGETVPVTAVEAVALNPSKAVAWLAELGDVMTELWETTDRLARVLSWDPAWLRPAAHRRIQLLCNTWPPTAEHTTRTIIRLANTAATLWPPQLAPGQTKPAQTFDSETCLYCQIDAYPGDRRAIKTPDGAVEGYVHTNPCWYAVTITRGPQHQPVRIATKVHR